MLKCCEDNPHENKISCLGVNPNGTALCTGSWDTLLKVSLFRFMFQLAFSALGDFLYLLFLTCQIFTSDNDFAVSLDLGVKEEKHQ